MTWITLSGRSRLANFTAVRSDRKVGLEAAGVVAGGDEGLVVALVHLGDHRQRRQSTREQLEVGHAADAQESLHERREAVDGKPGPRHVDR